MGEHHVSGRSPVGSGVGEEEILPVSDLRKILAIIQMRHGLLSEKTGDYRLSGVGCWLLVNEFNLATGRQTNGSNELTNSRINQLTKLEL
jgi:hypothetical protein